jgi:hypothetical protein
MLPGARDPACAAETHEWWQVNGGSRGEPAMEAAGQISASKRLEIVLLQPKQPTPTGVGLQIGGLSCD